MGLSENHVFEQRSIQRRRKPAMFQFQPVKRNVGDVILKGYKIERNSKGVNIQVIFCEERVESPV